MPEENKSFDELLKDIPEEQRGAFQSALDRERTRAAQTARENTKRTLSEDNEFLKTLEPKFKEKFELEANMTAEDKLKERATQLEAREKQIQLEENKLLAKQTLLSNGLSADECTSVLDFVVSNDAETTKGKINDFLNIVKPMANKMAQAEIKKHIDSYPNPTEGGNNNNPNVRTAAIIQKELRQAQEMHDVANVSRLAKELSEIK